MRLPKNTYIVILILVIVFLLPVFLFKAEWLTIDIGSNFPAGTLIAWLLIITFAMVMLLVFKRIPEYRKKQIFVIPLKINVILALVWGFVSFLLSENWSFNFSSGMWFTIWIYYTLIIFVVPLIVLISYSLILLIHKICNSK